MGAAIQFAMASGNISAIELLARRQMPFESVDILLKTFAASDS
jgi:hypothetical protein